MLPKTSAIPSAGRIVPNTLPLGNCTTNRHNAVRVSTLTSTLTAKPKNALVSPRTQYGSARSDPVRVRREGSLTIRGLLEVQEGSGTGASTAATSAAVKSVD